MKFNVTYGIITPESAENGELDESGFICENEDLRYAIKDLFRTRTNQVGGIECIEPSDSRVNHSRWITVYNSMEYVTGAHEHRSLHRPEGLSDASWCRIVRLIS